MMEREQQKRPSLWRNRDFLLLWSGQGVSVLGTRVSGLALPLLVLATTHSAVQAGLITSARMLPYLLLGLPAGALIDRWNRKTTMIVCDLARFVALGAVPLAWSLGHLSLILLYVVALVQGTAFVFFNVAEVASLPNVVAREDLPKATSLDSAAGSAGSLVGPGLAGAIIGAAKTTEAGAVLAYLVDALTYLLSLLSLGFIRVPFQAERPEDEEHSLRAQVADGISFLWKDTRLRTLALLSWALSFLYAPVSLAMIVLARDELHASPRTIGLIFSLSAVGGLTGALVAPRLESRFSFGQVVIGAVALQALVTPLVGLAVSPAMMIAGWSIAFLLDPVISMASTTYRLSVIPDDIQGRVQSIYRLGGYGAEPLGTALGAVCLALVGPRVEILAIAAGVGLCAVVASLTCIRKTGWPDLEQGHAHQHQHDRMVHTHEHAHDEHHQHSHPPGIDPKQPHTHEHAHEPLAHSHPHQPDLHHRHGHD